MTSVRDCFKAHGAMTGSTFYFPSQIGPHVILPPPRGLKRLYLQLFGVPDVRIHLTAAYFTRATARFPAHRVLDIGSGNGYLTCLLAEQHPAAELVGWDRDAAGVAFATRLAQQTELRNVRFATKDLERDELDGEYDCITCAAVLQFIQDTPTVISRLAGLLVPGGHLIIQVPVAASVSLLMRNRALRARLPPFLEARGGFSENECRELLEMAGFVVVEVQHVIKRPTILAKELFYLARSIDDRLAAALSPVLNWLTVLDPWYGGRGNGLVIVARKQ